MLARWEKEGDWPGDVGMAEPERWRRSWGRGVGNWLNNFIIAGWYCTSAWLIED